MRIHTYHSHAHKQIVGSLAFSVQGEDATRWIQRVNKAIGNEGNSRSAQAVRKACEVAGEGYLPAQAQPLFAAKVCRESAVARWLRGPVGLSTGEADIVWLQERLQ